jgi:hypothetical protein
MEFFRGSDVMYTVLLKIVSYSEIFRKAVFVGNGCKKFIYKDKIKNKTLISYYFASTKIKQIRDAWTLNGPL